MSLCEGLKPDLKAYLDGEIPRFRRIQIRRHLRHCPACRQEIEQMEKISTELRNQDSATLEPDLRAKLLSHIPTASQEGGSTNPTKPTRKGRFDIFRQKPMQIWATASVVLIAWFVMAPLFNVNKKEVATVVAQDQVMARHTTAGAESLPPLLEGLTTRDASANIQEKPKRAMLAMETAPTTGTPPAESDGAALGVGGGGGGFGGDGKEPATRKTHRTAEMTVEVGNVESATESIENRVKTSKGGYLAETQLSTLDDGTKTATLKIKIPVDEFDAFLSSVAKQGIVKAKSSTGEDITEKTSDAVQEQRSLTQQLEEARQKLQSARTRTQHNEANTEVRELRVSIAEAEGRLELFKKLARLSDVTITINEKSKEIKEPTKTGGFLDQIKETAQAAEENFFTAARYPVLLLIWIAVYSPLWLFVLFVFRLIRKQSGWIK